MAEQRTGYAALTVDQLSTELERRGLPKSGKKDDLITRLVDDDAAQGGAREAVGAEEPVEEAAAEPVAAAEPEPADDDAEDEPEDEPEAAPDEPAEDAPATGRRRGSAETVARRDSGDGEGGAVRVPRDAQGVVAVRAHARYVRTAPRKARLVMDHIRGKRVDDARALLRHTPRRAATPISKLLESAVANAENNFELDPDDLTIHRAFVDEGPTIKRYRPRAQGRATPIDKRTSHMTITLTTNES